MKKAIYSLSIFLTSVVTMFVVMKLLGFVLWVNNALLDKWMSLIGLFAVPAFVYVLLRNKEVKQSKVIKVTIFIVMIHAGWLWWSIQQPYNYTYIESNQIISSPYLVYENQNWTLKEKLHSKYTLFKSVNPILFVKESVRDGDAGLVDGIRWSGGNTIKKDNSIYINTKYGNLLVK
ncbi:hypothetical protein ABES25_15545 [Bacillus gobiensis]|uniref:hypothetical protein n=1 Tax=Bacillus gobiensis TaxID=1441095 RepID=UPI003D19ED33